MIGANGGLPTSTPARCPNPPPRNSRRNCAMDSDTCIKRAAAPDALADDAPAALPPLAYQAPWWLPNRHLQTIVPALLARKPEVGYRRERWNTPDRDFIDLDWLAEAPAADAPLVVLFHGLEGNSHSHYARALLHAV